MVVGVGGDDFKKHCLRARFMTMEFIISVDLGVEDVLVKLFCMEGEMKGRWKIERDACSVPGSVPGFSVFSVQPEKM